MFLFRLSVSTIVLYLLNFICAERLHEQIYSSIEGGAACFKRLNGTHQTGCSSSDKGAVGVVEIIRDESDAQWLVFNSSAGPYMAVVSTAIFHDVAELLMTHPENLAGVLLYDNITSEASSFSQESRCPNEYSSGPGSQCSASQKGGIVWNEHGTGLLRRDIPFPMFYLPDSRFEEITKIEECYQKFNLDKSNQRGMPLCSLQLNSFMFAAVNSAVCLRRSATSALLTSGKVCDPLGDHNVYYSLFPRSKESNDDKKPVTLVTARIDTASLFDGVSPGAASSVVGMVTLITAASTLANMIPITDASLYKQNILWTLLNGEAFDYIGSQRVAYDIKQGSWPSSNPLSPADINLHLELGQLGGLLQNTLTSWPLYAFAPYDSVIPQEITEFLNYMSSSLDQSTFNISLKFTQNLPPSSLHSFRRILGNSTESGALPELLLVDHDDKFTNMFYQSALDRYDKVGFDYHNISISDDGKFISTEELLSNGTMKTSDMQVKVARLATGVARSLYQQVTGKAYTENFTASAHLVDEMLYCFLRSQACRLLRSADYGTAGDENLPDKPAPLYVSVATWSGTAAVFAGHLLALLTGQHLPANRTACDALSDPDYSYYWLKGWDLKGVCIQTTMNFSQAVSPAFLIQDYDLSSGTYSTWTESVWQEMWARVFVSSGGGGARLAAIIGALTTFLTGFLTFWLRRHAQIVFVDLPASSLVNSDATTGILRTVNC